MGVVITISAGTFSNSISSLGTDIFDNISPGQVTPYSPTTLPTLSPPEFRDYTIEGYIPHVNVVENHWPFYYYFLHVLFTAS